MSAERVNDQELSNNSSENLSEEQAVNSTQDSDSGKQEGENNAEYKGIFKSTFLFSVVRVIQILAGIIKAKFVAVLLGPEGVGILGIYQSTISLIQTGTGLGISSSAVRDVSAANKIGDKARFSRVISLTNRVIIFTALLGLTVTVVLAPKLSQWTFGNKDYTYGYILLGVVVAATILCEGQKAVLTGMRRLRALAGASLVGSIVGLFTAIPLYYIWGKAAVVPALLMVALSALFFSNYCVRKIKYDRIPLTLKETASESWSMVKMGISFMTMGLTINLFNVIVASFIRHHNGLETVGYFNAGVTVITSYLGIVVTAMSTDYYPRICAVYQDNRQLQVEVNRQSEVGLIMLFPLAVLFVYLSPLIIQILYSKSFIATLQYTDIAILGTIINVPSDCLGMVMLAKQKAALFLSVIIIQRVLYLPVYILSSYYFGLTGLGIAFMLSSVLNCVITIIVIGEKYKIKFSFEVLLILAIVLTSMLATTAMRHLSNIYVSHIGCILIFIFSSIYTYYRIKYKMHLDPFSFITKKLRKS